MAMIFRLAAVAVNFYSFVCFIRIIITWIPNLAFTSFGKLLAAICDPFLNLFRKIKWLRFGMVDFSPLVALAILTAISSVLSNIALTGRIYLGGIIAMVVSIAWSVISSLATFLLLIISVRFLVMCFSKSSNYYGSVWSQLDGILSPFVFRITSFFTGGKSSNYKSALLAAIIMLVVLLIVGRLLISYLVLVLQRIPV